MFSEFHGRLKLIHFFIKLFRPLFEAPQPRKTSDLPVFAEYSMSARKDGSCQISQKSWQGAINSM
jgi:hypothetical protein